MEFLFLLLCSSTIATRIKYREAQPTLKKESFVLHMIVERTIMSAPDFTLNSWFSCLTHLFDHLLGRIFRKCFCNVVFLQLLTIESGFEVDGRDLADEAVTLLGPAADGDVTDGDGVNGDAVLVGNGRLNT